MDLIQFLFVVMYYYTSGNAKVSPEGEKVIHKFLETSFPIQIPYLGDVLTAVHKGKDLDCNALSFALRQFVKEYKAHPEAKLSFSTAVGMFATWFKNSSPNALKALVKISSLCADPYVRALIKVERVDQAVIKSKMVKVAKQLGYSTDHGMLDADQSKLAKAGDPEKYKDYLALRRQHTQAWKDEISEMVRSSGQKTLPYAQVDKALKKKGIEHAMPTGFTGRIDADGNWYTNDEQIITGVPAVSMFPEVVMNETGKGDWVFVSIRTDGTQGNYFSTKATTSKNNADKFAFTGNFIKKLPSYRKRWLANIKEPFDYSAINAVSSVVIELLFLSSQRVGTVKGGNSTGSGFGMSSILNKMVTIRPDKSVLISYAGKDGIPVKFTLTPGTAVDKVICNVLAKLKEDKKPSDPVFTRLLRGGAWADISSGSITKYFKSLTGGANIHKLRTAAGTGLFEKVIEGYYIKYGERKLKPDVVLDLCKKAALQVAKKLGHYTRDANSGSLSLSPATSLKNYIDPGLQVELFRHFGVPVPPYLEKLLQVERTITSRLIAAAESESESDAPADAGDAGDEGAEETDDGIQDVVTPAESKEQKTEDTDPTDNEDDRGPDENVKYPPGITKLVDRYLAGDAQINQGV